MKSYPITFDLYRKLIQEPLNERVTILLNNEFSNLRQSLTRPVKPVNTLCKLNNGVNYLLFEIDNTSIPVSLFKSTRDVRGLSRPANTSVDFIAGIYLEKRFQSYEDKIKAQVADGLQNNYSAGDWVIRRLNTNTKYIHNVFHKAKLFLGEKIPCSYYDLIQVTPLSNLLTMGDYVITNSYYPDQSVNFTVIGQDSRLLIPEFCEVPADMNKIVNKVIFINNLIKLNPTVIN